MLRLLGLLLWYCMKNLILNQDALPPSCFSHIQATLFYCLVHPLVGNTRCCHHPHQKNQVHCTLEPDIIEELVAPICPYYLPRGGSNVNLQCCSSLVLAFSRV
ncbi:hypothetical protein K1719_030134 [Acacia pycnantha]|nr:hypothetical protein K1719_030134 [Acacia pycnantha]